MRKEFGELTYSVIKDIAARMGRGEIEESDLKAAGPAPAAAAIEDSPAAMPKKQRASSASK